MEGDSFSDPRRRSARGRGRGRGAKSTRARGKTRRGPARSLPEQPGPTSDKLEELGSNSYRFRQEEEEEEEDFDAGADFEQAAQACMQDPNAPPTDPEQLGMELKIGMTGMEAALQSVPLWIRLGDGSRFSLGVSQDDVIDNYVDKQDREEEQVEKKGAIGQDLAEELAQLDFEPEEEKDEFDQWLDQV